MAGSPKDGALPYAAPSQQFAAIQTGFVRGAFDDFSSALAEKRSDDSLQKFELLGVTIHGIGAGERLRGILPIEHCQHWIQLKNTSDYSRHAIHWSVDLAEGRRIFADADVCRRLGEPVNEAARERAAALVTAAEMNLRDLLPNLCHVDAGTRKAFLSEISRILDELFGLKGDAMKQSTVPENDESGTSQQLPDTANLRNVIDDFRKAVLTPEPASKSATNLDVLQIGFIRQAYEEFSLAFTKCEIGPPLKAICKLGETIEGAGAGDRVREACPVPRRDPTQLSTSKDFAWHAVLWAIDLSEGNRRCSSIRLLIRLGESVTEEERDRAAKPVTAAEFNLPALLRKLRRVDAATRSDFLREMSGMLDELFRDGEKVMKQPTPLELQEAIAAVKNVAELANVLEPLQGRFDETEILLSRMALFAAIHAVMTMLKLPPPPSPIGGALPVMKVREIAERWRQHAEIVDSTKVMLVHAYTTCRIACSISRSDTPALPPSATEGEGGSISETSQELEPRERKAYFSFFYAEATRRRSLSDAEAYEVLKDEEIDPENPEFGELAGYEPPSFLSWARYLSSARGKMGQGKYRPRALATPTRSIVRVGETDKREESE